MSMRIYDHEIPDLTHDLYDVTFFDDKILTLVTDTPSYVDSWISETEYHYFQDCIQGRCFQGVIVGLDVEWRPSLTKEYQNPVATLQLCVGHRCLVFQILHAPYIPTSLENFLTNPNYTFVGVGIDNDVKKLEEDYNLGVSNTTDLRDLSVNAYGDREMYKVGLKGLALKVLGKEVNKPKSISLSRWDEKWLTRAQVQYACVDAFLSYEIGKDLIQVGNVW